MFVYKTKSITLFDEISDTMVVNTGNNYHVEDTLTSNKINQNKNN